MPTVTRAMFAAINSLISPRAPRTGDPTPTDALVTEVEPTQFFPDSLPDGPTTWATLDTRIQQNESQQRQMQDDQTKIKEDQTTILQLLHALAANQVLASPTTVTSSTEAPLCQPTGSLTPVLSSNTTTVHTFTPETSTANILTLPTVEPPLPLMRTSWYIDLPFTQDFFERWYRLFFIKCMACELRLLCDRTTQSFVASTSYILHEERLYARVMECLGPTNSFTERLDLAGLGLKLLNILTRVYGPSLTYEYMQEQSAYFWHSMHREASESVDEYFNRFHVVLSHLPLKGTNIPTTDIRRRFLFTLGGEFDRLVTEARDHRLDPNLIIMSWDDLLDELRSIASSYKILSSGHAIKPLGTPTASTMGYSIHAVTTTPADAAKIQDLEAKLALLEKAKEKADATASKRKAEAKAAISNGPDFYCHTHGFGKNPLHTSMTCIKRSPGHNEFATAADTMGGSTYKHQPR